MLPYEIKTSLAPGSKVVTRYLDRAGLTPYLQALGFHLVGYGCTTCIGNSGPLPEGVAETIRRGNLVAAACADRHARRGPLLPPRRDPAVRPAEVGREGVKGRGSNVKYHAIIVGAGSAGCVVDASIMLTIPAANTNLQTLMLAERRSAWLAKSG